MVPLVRAQLYLVTDLSFIHAVAVAVVIAATARYVVIAHVAMPSTCSSPSASCVARSQAVRLSCFPQVSPSRSGSPQEGFLLVKKRLQMTKLKEDNEDLEKRLHRSPKRRILSFP